MEPLEKLASGLVLGAVSRGRVYGCWLPTDSGWQLHGALVHTVLELMFVHFAVVTDGKPQLHYWYSFQRYGLWQYGLTGPAQDQADAERAKGYTINAIGVGSETEVSTSFLSYIASEPKERHWARVTSFSNLDSLAASSSSSCGTELPPAAGVSGQRQVHRQL